MTGVLLEDMEGIMKLAAGLYRDVKGKENEVSDPIILIEQDESYGVLKEYHFEFREGLEAENTKSFPEDKGSIYRVA